MKNNWNLSYTPIEYSQEIWMEFGIEKCALLVMKSGKGYMTDGIELQKKNKKKRQN